MSPVCCLVLLWVCSTSNNGKHDKPVICFLCTMVIPYKHGISLHVAAVLCKNYPESFKQYWVRPPKERRWEEEEKSLCFHILRCLSMWLGALLVFKHKDEWYIAIQAYKFTDYEILYCVSMLSSHTESTNSTITHQNPESAAIPPTTTIFSLSSLRQSVEHCR